MTCRRSHSKWQNWDLKPSRPSSEGQVIGDGLVIGRCSVAGFCLEQLRYSLKSPPMNSTRERVRARPTVVMVISGCAFNTVISMGHNEHVVDNFSSPGAGETGATDI